MRNQSANHLRRTAQTMIAAVLCMGTTGSHAQDENPLQPLHDDASALREVFASPAAHEMLDEVDRLPVCDPKTIYVKTRPNKGLTQDQYDASAQDVKDELREFSIDPMRYYSTFYGTPLVYARILDLVEHHAPGTQIAGKRILDLGYGQLGQLRLWAQMDAQVVGVEIDNILTALYSGCESVGTVHPDQGDSGSVELIEGAWPNDAECRAEVGDGYDLVVSRNLLKRGYVKPAQLNPAFPVPVGWTMSDEEVVGHFFDLLNEGGLVVIESLGPKPDPEKPWSDIANPWAASVWESAGFEVIAHDEDESAYARAMGKALGWDERMNLEEDLHGVYSVYRKPETDQPAK